MQGERKFLWQYERKSLNQSTDIQHQDYLQTAREGGLEDRSGLLTLPENPHHHPQRVGTRSGGYRSRMSTSLMHAHVILEGLWEPEASIRPGHKERRTDEVVIRVVAEVRGPRRRARRTRIYLE